MSPGSNPQDAYRRSGASFYLAQLPTLPRLRSTPKA